MRQIFILAMVFLNSMAHAQSIGESVGHLKLEYDSEHLRQVVELTDEYTDVTICNLLPGETYILASAPLNMENPCSFEIGANKTSFSTYLMFVADESCEKFWFRRTCSEEVTAYLSLSCSSCLQKEPNDSPEQGLAVTAYTGSLLDLVRDNFIGGNCFDISNVTFSGNQSHQLGIFSNGANAMGLDEGIILSTGNVVLAEGPNSGGDIGSDEGANSFDADLDGLTSASLHDAAILEFDFVPTTPMINFDFVFGSEEYCEYVNAGFNDVFGFFISGPGYPVPTNIALVPGTGGPGSGTPVAIDNVNDGLNSQFFVGNSSTCSGSTSNPNIEYDGYTTVLTAEAIIYDTMCATYHLKLAIADAGDNIYDSGVFLRKGSFNAGANVIVTASDYVLGGIETTEGCGNAYFRFELFEPQPTPVTINFTLGGTATEGLDYDPVPLSIVIDAGATFVDLPINVLADGIYEGFETLELIVQGSSCSCLNPQNFLYILDAPPVNVATENITACEGNGPVALIPSVSGTSPFDYSWSTGTTGASSITVATSEPGVAAYTVTVTDDCGGQGEGTFLVTTMPRPSAVISGDGAICNGDSASIDLVLTGESPWSVDILKDGAFWKTMFFTDSISSFMVGEPGIYEVSFVSANGLSNCSGTGTGIATIVEDNLQSNSQVIDESCAGANDGTIQVIPLGNGTYSYNWSPTQPNSAVITGLPQGTYEVTITADNGCTATETYTVGGAPPFDVSSTTQGVDCAHPSDGSISLSVSGATPGYTYQWAQSSSTSQSLTGLSAGTYVYTITDNNGCEYIDSATVNSGVGFPVAMVESASVIDCNHPSIILSGDGSTDDNGTTYLWTTSDGNIITGANSLFPTVDLAGTYQLSVTNSLGCSKDTSITVVSDLEQPVADVVALGQLDCNNAVLTLVDNGSSTGGDFSYSWTTVNGNLVSGISTLTPVVDESGTYTLVVTDTTNGCTADVDVLVGVDTIAPQANATVNGFLSCIDSTLTLNGSTSPNSNNYSYQWTTVDGNILLGDTTLTPIINQQGSYQLLVTNMINGCTNTSSVDVSENFDVATPDAGESATLGCTQTTVLLHGNIVPSTASFEWVTVNGNFVSGASSLTPEVNAGGDYFLVATHPVSGCTSESVVTVSLDQNVPQANAGTAEDLTCVLTSEFLDASNSSQGSNFIYQWTTTDGNIVQGNTSLHPEVDMAGTYQLVVTDTTNGCTSLSTVVVELNNQPPLVDAGNDAVINCNSPVLTIGPDVPSGNSNLTYNWTTTNGNILSGSESENPTIDAQGTYHVLVTDMTNGCTSEDQVMISEDLNYPTVNLVGDDEITCTATSATISATATGAGDVQYDWTTTDGNIQQGNGTNAIVTNQAGLYVVKVTNLENGCAISDSFEVQANVVLPEATAMVTGMLTCSVDSVNILGAGSSIGGDFVYSWSTLDGHIVSQPTVLDAVVDEPGTYTLGVTNVNNHCASTFTVQVEENMEIPLVDAGVQQTLSCGVDSLQLSGSGSSNFGNIDYLWTTQTGSILSGNTTSTPFVNASGTYYLLVTDALNGCLAVDSVFINQDINVPIVDVGPDATINCQTSSIALGTTNTSTGSNFSYHWTASNGGVLPASANTPFITVTDAGTYELEVINTDNGCKSVSVAVVEKDMDLPQIDPGLPVELNCLVDSILLGGPSTSSGVEFSYEWTTTTGHILSGSNNAQAMVDQPGIYSLLVSNTENFCASELSISVTQNVEKPLVHINQADTITCMTPSIVLSGNGSSVGSNFDYQWTTSIGNIVAGDKTLTPEVNQPGSYALQIVDSTNGCISMDSVDVLKDNSQPTAFIEPDSMLTCSVNELYLDASGSSVGNEFEYTWTTTNGNIIAGADSLILHINQPGDYHLNVTNLSNNCVSYADITIVEDVSVPIVEAGANVTLTCGDSTVMLNGLGSAAGAQFLYQWSSLDGNLLSGNQSLEPIVNQVGTYFLVVENTINGCKSMDSVVVVSDINAPVIMVLDSPKLTCDVLETIIDASNSSGGPDFEYSWSTPDGHILTGAKTNSPLVDKEGKYVLKLTNILNGCTTIKEVNVEKDIEEPSIDGVVSESITCKVPAVEIQALASGSGSNFDYAWTTTNGHIVSGEWTPQPMVDSMGTYSLVVKDLSNGCTSEKDFAVSQNKEKPDLLAATPSDITCKSPTAVLSVSSDSNVTYDWTALSGNIVSGVDSSSITVNQTGVYEVHAIDSINGCTASKTISVNENLEKPVADAGADFEIPCTSDFVEIGPNSVNPNYIYSWSTASGNIISGSGTAHPIVAAAGIYSLSVEDRDNGCLQEDMMMVTEAPKVVDLALDVNGVTCKGIDGVIAIKSVTGGTPPYLFSFDNGASFNSLQAKENLPSGSYKVIVQDAMGCEYDTYALVSSAISPNIQTEDVYFIELGDSIQLQVFSSLLPDEIDTIIWNPTDALSCTNCLNPIAKPTISSNYDVLVIDQNGCDASARISIFVSDPDVYIPNVFAPGSTNLANSSFYIHAKLEKVKEITSLFIVDRWGDMVFLNEHFMPNDPYSGWDGKFKGIDLPPGVFVYHAIVEFVSGKIVSYSGDVTIIR